MTKIMSCGCAENGIIYSQLGVASPGCVEHKAVIPSLTQPDLKDRLAKCALGCLSSIVPSRPDLPFFKYREKQFYDEYLCDCQSFD